MNITLVAVGFRPWESWIGYWGLSILIDSHILFDTFSSYRVLSKRLRSAGAEVEDITDVVISHDHWDHVGGLWGLLETKKGVNVHLPMHAKEETKIKIQATGNNVLNIRETTALNENVYITSEIAGSYKDKEIHEQSLVLRTDKGLILIVGCSHPGITKIVQNAKSAFGLPVHGIVGGLHLMRSSGEEIRKISDQLHAEGISLVAPTHCTGRRAEKIFGKRFASGFMPMCEGENLLV